MVSDTTDLGPEVGRRSCFVPLPPELTMYLCSAASTLLQLLTRIQYMHISHSDLSCTPGPAGPEEAN